jgi:hypothetical protein
VERTPNRPKTPRGKGVPLGPSTFTDDLIDTLAEWPETDDDDVAFPVSGFPIYLRRLLEYLGDESEHSIEEAFAWALHYGLVEIEALDNSVETIRRCRKEVLRAGGPTGDAIEWFDELKVRLDDHRTGVKRVYPRVPPDDKKTCGKLYKILGLANPSTLAALAVLASLSRAPVHATVRDAMVREFADFRRKLKDRAKEAQALRNRVCGGRQR